MKEFRRDHLEGAVKYVILIYTNPASREAWYQLPAEQVADGMAAYSALNEDLEASGEMIVSEALAFPATAKTVRVRNGETVATDGPFAEVKEHLAGFYLVDCATVERVVEIAARIPEAQAGLIEIRPVMDLSAFEM
jgi:hypothetical protein